MKKLFFFLFASMLLCSCSCLLSQIPPKYIYAEAGCKAPIPNYIPMVTVTGGCTGFTVTQMPLAGTIITIPFVANTVTIKATGLNGKSSQIQFTVTMQDTITPVITPLPALMAYQQEQVKALYDAGDKITIAMFKEFDKAFPWSGNYAPGAGPMRDSEWDSVMLVSVSIDSAGFRKRITTYGDTVVINPGAVEWDDILYKPTDFPTSIHIHGWEQIIHPTYLDNEALKYPVNFNEFMDWQASREYMPIPARVPSGTPNLALVNADYSFSPLVYDPTAKKMKFWNGAVWKTLTSN